MSLPNLSHLAAFVAVARLLSFQRGAASLGMSTSAMSHAIRGLEERLGVSLFHRTTRSVSLTEAGQRLLERLQPVLLDVDDALEEMNNFRAVPTGTLRINTSRAAAQLMIAPLMARFLTAYPEIQLEIVDEDGFVDIAAGGFDAGVRFLESVPEDMVAISIGPPCRFVVVGSPAYFRSHACPVHPDDLARHDCVRYRFPSGRVFKWEFEKAGKEIVLAVEGRLTVGNQELAMTAALDGISLAFMLEEVARPAIEGGRLLQVLDDWCPYFPNFMLYYPRQRRMPSALRAFIDMVRSAKIAG